MRVDSQTLQFRIKNFRQAKKFLNDKLKITHEKGRGDTNFSVSSFWVYSYFK